MKDTLSRWNGLQSPGSQKYFSIEIYGFAPLSRPIDFHNTQSPFNNIHPFVFVVFVQWPPCLCPYHVNITRNIAKVDPHVLFSSIRDRILSEQRRWDPFGIRYLKYELVCIMNQTIFWRIGLSMSLFISIIIWRLIDMIPLNILIFNQVVKIFDGILLVKRDIVVELDNVMLVCVLHIQL